MRSSEPQNWIPVDWDPEPGETFNVRILVTAQNVRGLLGRVATAISQAGVNIESVSMGDKNPGMCTELHFLIQVSGRAHLARLIRTLRRIPDVARIVREQG